MVCVVSLEESNITPGNVPYELCREIRTGGSDDAVEDTLKTIIIPSAAIIVAVLVFCVIVFIACLKSSQRRRKGKVCKLGFKINI